LFTRQFVNEFDDIIDDVNDKVHSEILNIYSEVINVTPVDTGDLRQHWEYLKLNKYRWIIVNDLDYAESINRGRRFVGEKTYGSLQLPDGWEPMITEMWEDIRL